MAWSFIAKKFPRLGGHYTLGLDIQPNSIRLAKFRHQAHLITVEQLLTKEVAFDLMENNLIRQHLLVPLLLELVEQGGLRGQKVAISLPISCVQWRRTQLPMPVIEEDIKREMDEPDCYIDFSIREETVPGYADIVVASVKANLVEQWVECIKQVGLKLRIIDIDAYAIRRAVCFAKGLRLHGKQLGLIFYFSQKRSLLLGFDVRSLLFHHVYLTKADVLAEFKQQFQTIKTAYSQYEMTPLLVCGDDFSWEGVQVLNCLHPFLQMQLADLPLPPDVAHYWLASGLALREMPRW